MLDGLRTRCQRFVSSNVYKRFTLLARISYWGLFVFRMSDARIYVAGGLVLFGLLELMMG